LILGSLVAIIFSETMTVLTLILRRKGWGWRMSVLTIIGSIVGAGLFTFVAGQWLVLWFAGGIIGLVLAWFPDGLYEKSGLQHTSFALIPSVVVFVTSLVVLDQVVVENRDPLIFMGAAFSAALFTGLYIYLFGRNTEIPKVAS
jgi:hypothetical protein